MNGGEAIRIAFHRSIAGKLTGAGVVLTLAIILILYAATRYAVSHEVLRNLQAGIDTDIAGLADLHASGGRAELVRRIGDRIDLHSEDAAAYYLLLGQDGRPVIGNLGRWPELDASRSQAGGCLLYTSPSPRD